MFSYDIKFLTNDESLILKKTDFKVFKYESRKSSEETVYDFGKRNYTETRGELWRTVKPRQLRQLDSKLRERNVVISRWISDNLVTLLLSSGVIIYLTLKPHTLDVLQILFDKYCIGKLANPTVVDAVISKTHLLFTHSDRLVTLVSFGKYPTSSSPTKISDRDPHVQIIELGGGSRRGERRVSWRENGRGVRVLLWSAVAAEPAPWSPALQHQANLHIYQISGTQVTLLAYHQLENDTLLAELSALNEDSVHIVEQVTCHKTGVNVEWSWYSVCSSSAGPQCVAGRGSRAGAVRATLSAPARAARLHPADVRLLLACIDGAVHVLHHLAGLTHTAKPGFIASSVLWCGSVCVAAEERGRVQCFDRALAPLPHARPLHLAAYYRESRRVEILSTRSIKSGLLILTAFSGGPLALVRITHPHLLTTWIRQGRTNNAIALLRTMEWESEGCECLRGVTRLVQRALRDGEVGEETAIAALGVFLAPSTPLPPAALRYAPHVHDVARKFFHHLLRRGRIEKALSLAVDLRAWDLFVDCAWSAKRARQPHLAQEAAALAVSHARTDSECTDSCSQCSSNSCCSESVGATSSTSDIRTQPPPLPRVRTQPPPVPPHSLSVSQPSLVPVPRTFQECHSTVSIRPNLHQYLDRENTIWNIEVKDNTQEKNPNVNLQNTWHSAHNLFPRHDLNKNNTIFMDSNGDRKAINVRNNAHEVTNCHVRNVFQTDLREDAPSIIYRYYSNNNFTNTNNNKGSRLENNNGSDRTALRPIGEKNKVKFSDTVTVTVVSGETNFNESTREQCGAYKYLSPVQSHLPQPSTMSSSAASHSPSDNAVGQKTPKIKVVHFGMV